MTSNNEKSPDSGSDIQDSRSSSRSKRKTVLAIASSGGHWIQLRRLHPAFEGSRILYATTRESYRQEVEIDKAELRVVPDCNRWEKFKLVKSALKIALLLMKEKPDTIITTGAAPGYFAIRLGKLLGKKTIWVDSIANAEELSLSGQQAGKHVDHWITQWKHLARPNGPHFYGNVLGDDTVGATLSTGQLEPTLPATIRRDKAAISNSAKVENRSPTASHKPSEPRLRVFVTVGTDLPFDRLIETMDNWAADHPEHEVFAQIGNSKYQPAHIGYSNFIEPPNFKKRFQSSDLIVSHAGMGTILSSLSYHKPLLVMPRIAAKGEHRNEHQLATAKHLQELNKINVAQDETQLLAILESLESPNEPFAASHEPSGSISNQPSAISHLPKASIGPYASESLTSKLNALIGGLSPQR